MDSIVFVKGWNRVYDSAENSCPACACKSPSFLAEENELTELSEPINYECKWHPFYISVKLKEKSGAVMINSAQAKHFSFKKE